jgi:hypothetical protein
VKDLHSNCKGLIFLSVIFIAFLPASGAMHVGQLTVTPASVNFGTVPVGTTQAQTVQFTNTGLGRLGIWNVTVSGADFQMSGLTFPVVLLSNQSVSFEVTFTAQSSGLISGDLSVATITSESQNGKNFTYVTVALSGTGSSPGQLNVSPASLNFGSVVDGSSSSLGTTLTATGESVTVSGATISNSAFSLSGISLPMTIAAGQSVPFYAVFDPTNVGVDAGTITFTSTATNSPAVLSVTGTGTSAPVYSVALSWDPSTSPVVGYNVYRGTVTGGPYAKINSSVDPSTVYTDNTVQNNQTYFYVTTSVAGDGSESTYSNQTQAVIP